MTARLVAQVPVNVICPQRILPVLVVRESSTAQTLAAALVEGGITAAEVTLRTAGALDAVQRMAENPDLRVGAGTVLTPEQVCAVAARGATFVVSPGFSRAVLRECQAQGLAYYPGVATPTDIQTALEEGLTELKFFPAETLGGVRTIRAFSAPFPDVTFIPTGGITEESLADYLSEPSVAAVGGSWLATADLLAQGDFQEITRRARAALVVAQGADPEKIAASR